MSFGSSRSNAARMEEEIVVVIENQSQLMECDDALEGARRGSGDGSAGLSAAPTSRSRSSNCGEQTHTDAGSAGDAGCRAGNPLPRPTVRPLCRWADLRTRSG